MFLQDATQQVPEAGGWESPSSQDEPPVGRLWELLLLLTWPVQWREFHRHGPGPSRAGVYTDKEK